MTGNVAVYNNLAANWATVMATGYTGELHVMLDSYTFNAAHGASDIASASLTNINTKLAFVTSGTFEVVSFLSNPTLATIPSGGGSYRFIIYAMQTSHTPLLWIDLGGSHSQGAGVNLALTIAGSLLGAST